MLAIINLNLEITMKYNFTCPFEDCLKIEFRLASELMEDGEYIELFVTEEDGDVTLYGWDSVHEYEDCILAQGILPVLKELVLSARLYASLKKEELATVYEHALGRLIGKILAQETLSHLMKVYRVDSTIDLVELLLNQGKLDWLRGL